MSSSRRSAWLPTVGAMLALALLPLPTNADTSEPDLYLVTGRDWRVVLPVIVMATRSEGAVPVLLPEEGKEPWFEHFIERYRPRRPLMVVAAPEPGEEMLGLPWQEAPPFPAGDEGEISPALLEGSADELAMLLAERLSPASTEGQEAGPPIWLVGSSDYRAGLLAAVAAGAEGGLLIPIGTDDEALQRVLRLAQAHRSPLRFAESDLAPARHAAASRSALERAAREKDIALEVVRGEAELTRRGFLSFSSGQQGELPSHLVMANPSDTEGWFSPPHLSLLAPLFAIARKAPLLLSEGSPEDMERRLASFETNHGPVTHVTLVGDYLALKMREMLDPDQVHQGVEEPRSFKIPSLIGLEELEPAEYAVGRLAAEDVHDLSLQVGRILAPRRALGSSRRPALMLANADEIFIMAELVSLATVREMENVGWEVSAHYSNSIDRDLIFQEMPGKEVVIWTGHPRDLTVDYDIGVVDQILDASLVFLQGCYTLDRNDPYVLVQQGAAAIIGTYMAVYSASGSAFAKTVIDSMLYHGADQGEAMVHARNYLLAYVEMKRRRGHSDWRKTWRAGLSFELWGDPTARTVPPRRRPRVPPVRLVRDDDDLRFEVPEDRFGGLSAGIYTLETPPGGQVGSIYRRSDEWGDERRMQPFYFGWVELPEMQARPSLETEIPDDMWVPLWSEARSRLYLMVHNRAEQEVGREGLVFRIVEEQVAEPGDPASEEQPETAATSGED